MGTASPMILTTAGTVSVLGLIIAVALIAIAVHLAGRRRKEKSPTGGPFPDDPAHGGCGDASLAPAAASSAPVFLLYVPDPATGTMNERLRGWLSSCDGVAEVLDLSDESLQEEVFRGQEDWVTGVLDRDHVRVVAVASRRTTELLHRVGQEEQPEDDPEQQLLVGGGRAGIAAEEGDGDALSDLRLFALRHVLSRMSGQYNRFMLISYEGQEPQNGGVEFLQNLTPHRRRLVLPTQAGDLARWLRSTCPSSSTSPQPSRPPSAAQAANAQYKDVDDLACQKDFAEVVCKPHAVVADATHVDEFV